MKRLVASVVDIGKDHAYLRLSWEDTPIPLVDLVVPLEFVPAPVRISYAGIKGAFLLVPTLIDPATEAPELERLLGTEEGDVAKG